MRRMMLIAAVTPLAALAALKGNFLHEMNGEVVTPHFDFRGSCAEKPLRTLFILDRRGARDAVEVVQRFNVDPVYVLLVGGNDLASDSMYEASWTGTSAYEKTKELDAKLEPDYDLYVFGKKPFSCLTDRQRYRILAAVRDRGAGLLFVNEWTRRLPYAKVYERPLGVPEFFGKFAKTTGKEKLEAFRLGEGLVVEFAAGRGGALTGGIPFGDEWRAKYENAVALAGAAMRYAARRGCEFSESCPAVAPVVRCRDRFNREEADVSVAGRHYRDTIGADGSVLVEEVTTPSPFGALALVIDDTLVPGRPLEAELRAERSCPAAKSFVAETLESPSMRVMTRKTLPAETRKFTVADTKISTKAGYLRVTALDGNGKPLEIVEAPFFMKRRYREDYIQMCWGSVPPLASSILVDRVGFRCALNFPDLEGRSLRTAALLNQHGMPYVTRIGLGSDKTGASKQGPWFTLTGHPEVKKMKEALKGPDCFYRPEVQALWRRGVAERIRPLVKYTPAWYSLGDENYFDTEGGYGEYDDRYFREYLKEKYGTVEKLNENWGENWKSFDEVPHRKQAEVKAAGNLAAWADHRGYREKMYADAHALCRDEIRKLDPGAAVGAEGSVPGELELTIAPLEFWGPYSDPIGDEVLRSFGGDRIRMLWWGGYPSSHGGRGSVPYPIPLMKDLARGAVMGSAWFDVSIGNNHGFFYSDFRLADDVADYIGWNDRFKDGLAQLLVNNPLKDEGILFYWSHPSQTAAKASEKCLAQSDGINTLMGLCYRNGRSFEFVSSRTLDRLASAKTLFLCGATALSDRETAAIRAFAEKGGTVVADTEPAVMNENLRWRKRPALADLWTKPNCRLFARKLSDMRAKEMPAAEFDRMMARFLPAAQTFVPADELPDNYLLRTRSGPGFDLVTAMAPNRDIGTKKALAPHARKHVYSAVEGYLGATDSLTLDFREGPFVTYALFDEVQRPPEFSLADARLGTRLRPVFPTFVPGREYRLVIRDPQGAVRWSTVFDREANAPKELDLAFDDPAGGWSATLVDVATLLKTAVTFRVTAE